MYKKNTEKETMMMNRGKLNTAHAAAPMKSKYASAPATRARSDGMFSLSVGPSELSILGITPEASF